MGECVPAPRGAVMFDDRPPLIPVYLIEYRHGAIVTWLHGQPGFPVGPGMSYRLYGADGTEVYTGTMSPGFATFDPDVEDGHLDMALELMVRPVRRVPV